MQGCCAAGSQSRACQPSEARDWLGTIQPNSPSTSNVTAVPALQYPCTRVLHTVHTQTGCSRVQLGLVARALASQQPVGSLVDGYHVAAGLRALPEDVLLLSAPTSRFSLATPVRPPAHEPFSCCLVIAEFGKLAELHELPACHSGFHHWLFPSTCPVSLELGKPPGCLSLATPPGTPQAPLSSFNVHYFMDYQARITHVKGVSVRARVD